MAGYTFFLIIINGVPRGKTFIILHEQQLHPHTSVQNLLPVDLPNFCEFILKQQGDDPFFYSSFFLRVKRHLLEGRFST